MMECPRAEIPQACAERQKSENRISQLFEARSPGCDSPCTVRERPSRSIDARRCGRTVHDLTALYLNPVTTVPPGFYQSSMLESGECRQE